MMTPDEFTAAAVGLGCLAASYCAGGLHGLYLGQTQRARMSRWAERVMQVHEAVKEAHHKGGLT